MRQMLEISEKRPYSTDEYIKKYIWWIVQSTLVRYSFPKAYRWRNFWLRLFGAKIGVRSGIRRTVSIVHPWLFELKDSVLLSERVKVYNLGRLVVGSNTLISHDVHLCGGSHDYEASSLPLIRSEIVIGEGVWICTEAFIGPGVHIANGCVVGARAVVTRSTQEDVVLAGNPAKVIKKRIVRDI